MNTIYAQLLRSLIAAQVAVLEHEKGEINETIAKAALIECLKEALRLAKSKRLD
jgi:hypothetical protein